MEKLEVGQKVLCAIQVHSSHTKLFAMDADTVFLDSIQEMGYSDPTEIDEITLVELALRFAIWPSTATYQKAPWLAPFAIRRIRTRVEVNAPGPKRDLWGLPTEEGYFADDNSLINKMALNRSLLPDSNPYGNAKISRGLVCCHIWAGTTTKPLLFSFVPNLVWLPKSLASYSDAHHAGTPHAIHFALMQVSCERYGRDHENPRVAKAWSLLNTSGQITLAIHACTELADNGKIAELVRKRINRLIRFLETTLDSNLKPPNRFSKRYHAGVGPHIDKSVWTVQKWLTKEVRASLIGEMRECL